MCPILFFPHKFLAVSCAAFGTVRTSSFRSVLPSPGAVSIPFFSRFLSEGSSRVSDLLEPSFRAPQRLRICDERAVDARRTDVRGEVVDSRLGLPPPFLDATRSYLRTSNRDRTHERWIGDGSRRGDPSDVLRGHRALGARFSSTFLCRVCGSAACVEDRGRTGGVGSEKRFSRTDRTDPYGPVLPRIKRRVNK